MLPQPVSGKDLAINQFRVCVKARPQLVFVDLGEGRQTGNRKNTQVFALAASALIVAMVFAFFTRDDLPLSRPVSLEEKDMIVAAFDRTVDEGPSEGILANEWRDKLLKSSLSIFVGKTADKSHWLESGADGLIVAPGFFDADPVAQEQSVKQLLAMRRSSTGPSSNRYAPVELSLRVK